MITWEVCLKQRPNGTPSFNLGLKISQKVPKVAQNDPRGSLEYHKETPKAVKRTPKGLKQSLRKTGVLGDVQHTGLSQALFGSRWRPFGVPLETLCGPLGSLWVPFGQL